MANEITLNIRLDYSNINGVKDKLVASENLSVDVGDSYIFHGVMQVQDSEGALELGSQDQIGYFIGVNRHASAIISLRQATGAANFCELGPGKSACFEFADATAAPFVISSVNDAVLEYMIVSA